MFDTTKRILSKLSDLLENLEFLRRECYDHGDKLRKIDRATTRILERQAETEVRPTPSSFQGEYISEGTLAKLRTQLGMPQRETNPGTYPHKLEAEYTSALRRYYEFHNGPYDGPMDQPSYAYPSPPSESVGYQTGLDAGLAGGYGELSVAQSQGQTGTDTSMGYNTYITNSHMLPVSSSGSLTDAVATDELFGHLGVRTAQEG